jgi:hypothetical protein
MLARMWGKGTLIHCWWNVNEYSIESSSKQYISSSKTKNRSAI